GALWCGTTIVSQAGSENWQRQMFHSDPVPEARGTFFRVETDGSSTNYDMVWGYPQLHAFQSTVSPAIFRFYRGIGLIRSVESTLPMEKEGARAILSGRYYLENLAAKARTNYTEEGGIEGYRLAQETAEYNIYENENYIPMGFTFDRYMTEKNYKSLPGETADRLLVKDLVLSEENAARYGYLMEEDTDTEQDLMTMEEFEAHCDARSKSACTRFSYDRDGYTAQADLPAKSLVFFSVPYDKGFSAYVDGVRTQIIEADFGLTAVLVPQGKHEIRLFYRPYGLAAGAAASALSAAALIALFFAERRRRILNKNSEKCYDNALNAVADARASMREEERL
ncbi:MAG: YfhO family protein, partial [Lachnospiraceae bacterium]|nr:YfhO family protein [Lachnospiraceae bacterium]